MAVNPSFFERSYGRRRRKRRRTDILRRTTMSRRRIPGRLALLGAALCLSALSAAARADQIYLTIEAASQGVLKGSVAQKGWEGKIAATKYALGVTLPTALATGYAGGKRQYTPVKV